MNTNAPHTLVPACTVTVIALIILCMVWESIGAPLHPLNEGFPWMALKGWLLLPLVARLWRGERRAYQILTLLILLYVTEGSVRAFSDITLAGRGFAWAEIVLSLLIFIWANKIARALRPTSNHAMVSERKPRPKAWTQLWMYLYASLLVLFGMSYVYSPDGTESNAFHQIVWLIRIGFIAFNMILIALLIKNGRAKAIQNRQP